MSDRHVFWHWEFWGKIKFHEYFCWKSPLKLLICRQNSRNIFSQKKWHHSRNIFFCYFATSVSTFHNRVFCFFRFSPVKKCNSLVCWREASQLWVVSYLHTFEKERLMKFFERGKGNFTIYLVKLFGCFCFFFVRCSMWFD